MDSSFPNEFPREVFTASLLAYASSEKNVLPVKKTVDKIVFPSAITAEGAAADFNRVPFYRKIAAVKIVDIKFKRYYRPKSGLCQPPRVTGARNENAGMLRKTP